MIRRYSDIKKPYAPKLVAKSNDGEWAYAVGSEEGLEYCITTRREWDDPQRRIPPDLRVTPTASLFKFNPESWRTV